MFHHPVRDPDRETDGQPARRASRDRDCDDVRIHLQCDLIDDEEEEDVHENRREEREEEV